MVHSVGDLSRSSVLYALPFVALVLGLVKVTQGQYGSKIGCMDNACNDKVHNLLERYEYAASEVNGCDTDCMYNCYDVLKEGLSAKDGVSCPPLDELTRCFGIYGNEWVSIAEECPIFDIKEQKEAAEAEADAEAEAEAPSSEGEGESEDSEAEAEAPSSEGEGESEDAEAEAEAPSPEGEGESEDAEAEAEAPSSEGEGESEDAEAEAEAPSPEGEGESEDAEAEAPSPEGEGESEDAEAEAASSEGEGEGECSASSSGEGEASDVGSGCFPDFETYEDFQKYVQGAYYSSVWNQPTNTVGVILSVFFWLSLGGMGVYLGRKS